MKAILNELNKNTNIILFIDEIHRLSPQVEEILYPAMEDFQLDIVIGQGPAARSIKMDIPSFTLIGATTRAGLLTNPLRDRFGVIERLEFYSHEELARIVERSADLLDIKTAADGSIEIARRSRGTPRRLLAVMIDKYNGGPVGIDTLAASISEERDTIEDVLEPYLLQEGLITRTPRGRTATPLAYAHMQRELPGQGQQEPLL